MLKKKNVNGNSDIAPPPPNTKYKKKMKTANKHGNNFHLSENQQ